VTKFFKPCHQGRLKQKQKVFKRKLNKPIAEKDTVLHYAQKLVFLTISTFGG